MLIPNGILAMSIFHFAISIFVFAYSIFILAHSIFEKSKVNGVSKRLRDSILSAFFHSYIFAMYKNEALWI